MHKKLCSEIKNGRPIRGLKNNTKIHTEYRHVPTDATVRFRKVRRKSNFTQVIIKCMANYVHVCLYTRMMYILYIQPHIIIHCTAVTHCKCPKNPHNQKLFVSKPYR
jgi:hypothetical protein